MLSLIFTSPAAGRLELEIEEEFASHLAACAAELAAQGLSEPEALAEARRRFGDIEAFASACRREAPHERFPSVNHCLRTMQCARSCATLQMLVVATRLFLGGTLIAIACIMGKVAVSPFLHQRVETTGDLSRLEGMLPIELLFRILSDSWPLWSFIGALHATAGALLVTQRFAKRGAGLALALFASLSIFTLSFDFTGTPTVFGAMLLACAFLLAWDLDSLQPLFRSPAATIEVEPETGWIASAFWPCLGATMVLATAMVFSLNIAVSLMTVFGVSIAGLTVFILIKALGRSPRFNARNQRA